MFELGDFDRLPSFGGSDERTEHRSKTALSPNAFGMILRRRRSSTKRRSSKFVVRIARRCVTGRSLVGDTGFEVVLEAGDRTLLAFYDFPAEHWRHLRTTNPIESAFATVRHRTTRSKGCLSNKTALTMVFKLAQAA